jgi:hypothetical protein
MPGLTFAGVAATAARTTVAIRATHPSNATRPPHGPGRATLPVHVTGRGDTASVARERRHVAAPIGSAASPTQPGLTFAGVAARALTER